MNKKDRREDILRKRNARKYAPKIVNEYKKPIYAFTNERDKNGNLELDERGAPLVKEVGHKMIKRKVSKFIYADAKSRKFREKKKKKGGEKR